MARSRLGRALGIAIALTVVALLLLPAASLPLGSARATGPSQPVRLSAAPISASVSWGGRNVSSAGSARSALGVSFGGSVDVHYAWSADNASGGNRATISDARLVMVYFGTALSTRDQVASAPTAQSNGSYDLAWDPGVVGYVLEGNYQFVASLLTPNGTTVWSETFYVHDTAPFGVLAAFPILLIAIILYELYAVAVIGRKARRPGAQPWQPSAPGSDGSEPDGTDGKSGGTG